MSSQYEVGKRYLHHKTLEPLTVRYIGRLPPTSSFDYIPVEENSSPGPSKLEIWLGIEYDDPSKGKHDGTYQGVSIFQVKQPGSGSFIRAKPGVLISGKTFVEAVEDRYGAISPIGQVGGAGDSQDVLIETAGTSVRAIPLGGSGGAIIVEAPNLEKIEKNLLRLERIREMGLDGEHISTLGGDDIARQILRERLVNLHVLNLSNSLISTWSELAAIVDCLPGLRTLVINNNRFHLPAGNEDVDNYSRIFSALEEIHLGRSGILSDDIPILAKLFPSVATLHLNDNLQLTALSSITSPSEQTPLFANLRSLDLSGCPISDFHAIVSCLSSMKSLEHLNISGIPLHTLQQDNPAGGRPSLPTIKNIILLDSRLEAWADIDVLHQIFLNISSLRFSISSISSTSETPEATNINDIKRIPKPTPGMDLDDKENFEKSLIRPVFIAKMPDLMTLNSTKISLSERRDAEMWYLRWIDERVLPEKRSSWGRYEELRFQHFGQQGHNGRFEGQKEKAAPTSSLKSKLIRIKIHRDEPYPLDNHLELPFIPSTPTNLAIRKLAKQLRTNVAAIELWTCRSLESISADAISPKREKVALVDDGVIGDWFNDGEDAIVVYV